MTSAWDKKRTADMMFSNVSPQIRETFMANVKKEQDKMDKEQAGCKDKPEADDPQQFLVQAPEDPVGVKSKPEKIRDGDSNFLHTATGQAQPADEPHETDDGDSEEDDGSDDGKDEDDPAPKKMGEALTAGIGMITPKPMLVSVVPGTEVTNDMPANCSVTTPGTDNEHTHMAYYDSAGNGFTSEDDGHEHVVRSFVVGDFQSADGGAGHAHSGVLTRPEDTPGSSYQPYDGEVR